SWDLVRPTSIGFDDQGRLFALESDALRWFLPTSSEPVATVAVPPVEIEQSDDRRRPGPQRKGEGSPARTGGFVMARSPNNRALIIARPGGFLTWHADDPDTIARLDRS